MKIVMQGSTVFAAAGTVLNALTGQRYERPPFDAVGDLYMAGTALATGTAEINVDGFSVSGVTNISGANRMPLVPDDLLIADWEAPGGGLIQLTIVATGAFTAYWKVILEEAYDTDEVDYE